MIGYFRQLGENVTRIQTDDVQQSTSSNDWLAESGLDKPSAADQQHAKGIGESESADEGSPKERVAKRKASFGNKVVNKAELVEFVEEEEGVAEWPNFGRQSSESAASSSFLIGNVGDFSQFDESPAGTSNAIGVENANDLTRKKRTKSAVIPCMDCGMLVANASTSLKSHVNLHHLKLPIYNCRLCGQKSTQLQKAAIVRHIERDHPGIKLSEISPIAAMAPVQIKWLHCDGFRRFELEEPTYAALMQAIGSRIPTFHGGLCYTDAEGDRILITCDLDFADMHKYFRRKCADDGSELVMKIQTKDGQNGERNAGERPAVTSSTSLPRQKQKIEVIELLESADESNSAAGGAERQMGTNDVGGGDGLPTNTALNAITLDHLPNSDGRITSMNEFMREMVKIDEKGQMTQLRPSDWVGQPGHSSWFNGPSEFDGNLNWALDGAATTTGVKRGVGPNFGVGVPNGMGDIPTTIGSCNLLDLGGHRMWANRRSVAKLIVCTQCGAGITNEHSSLKLHVNLHWPSSPREHSDRAETDFEHNSGKHRAELYVKIDECFPEAAVERKRRTATNNETENK
uniref:C2H2-type domain-containing protein n=1 Tax=Globodera pallida TaxID=36090 RepID=A0A183BM14_GLOPA